MIELPRLAEMDTFINEFTNVYTEHDKDRRSIRYCCAKTERDDAMHATFRRADERGGNR